MTAPVRSGPSQVAPPALPPAVSSQPADSLLAEPVEKPRAEVKPESIDVELVAGLPSADRPPAPSWWPPGRRDFLYLLLGAAGLFLIEITGWLLARLISNWRGKR